MNPGNIFSPCREDRSRFLVGLREIRHGTETLNLSMAWAFTLAPTLDLQPSPSAPKTNGTPGRTRRVYSWQVATWKRLSRPLNRTYSRQSDQPRACMEGCLVGTKRDDNLIPYPQIEA